MKRPTACACTRGNTDCQDSTDTYPTSVYPAQMGRALPGAHDDQLDRNVGDRDRGAAAAQGPGGLCANDDSCSGHCAGFLAVTLPPGVRCAHGVRIADDDRDERCRGRPQPPHALSLARLEVVAAAQVECTVVLEGTRRAVGERLLLGGVAGDVAGA